MFARRYSLPLAAVSLLAVRAIAQQPSVPQPVAGVANLQHLEGTDPGSGIHYVRLMLSEAAAPGQTGVQPRFTVECTDDGGKREMSWLVSFGGIADTAFVPPFRPTPQRPNAPKPPTVKLTMTFSGYTQWKPITTAWALLPSGELRYKDPGMKSPNLEPPQYYLRMLNSLPNLVLRYAHPQAGPQSVLVFQTRPLLDEIAKTPLCQ